MAKLDTSDSNSILTNVLIIIVVIAIAYLIYYLYTNKSNNVPLSKNTMGRSVLTENFQDKSDEENDKIKSVKGKMTGMATGLENPMMNKKEMNPVGNILGNNKMEQFSNNSQYQEERNLTSFPKDQLTADELLPQDNSSLWAQVNPSGVGSLKDRSFLQAGYNIGINTVGQTLRNANLQLRSEPPCPQVQVSPWLVSTIEPDVSRKPFEIGGCA
jgi:hypothetical protein